VSQTSSLKGDEGDALKRARGGPSGVESRGADRYGGLMTTVALAVWGQGLARVQPP